MIKIYDIGNSRAEIKVDKGTSYHEMLLGAEMLIEILVKDKGNKFEDVIDDIIAIYMRNNEVKKMKYDLEGICQDCMYLEKIKPLFEEKDKEIDRLKNIINELEKYCWELKAMGCREGALDMLDKIEELKENK